MVIIYNIMFFKTKILKEDKKLEKPVEVMQNKIKV